MRAEPAPNHEPPYPPAHSQTLLRLTICGLYVLLMLPLLLCCFGVGQ